MNRVFFVVVLGVFSVCLSFGQNPVAKVKIEGHIVDANNVAVEFATVVAAAGGTREAAGVISDSDGRFELAVPPGEYTLTCQCLGYETFTLPLEVSAATSLDDIILVESSSNIDEVVVRSQAIRREADRYVMNVAGTSTAIGRDALGMLSLAPGVWVTNDKITVNGREGVRVMIDERLLTMSMDDLIVYLRTINAEDIRKIEIIPYSGAEFDADSRGGVIKITMRKKRDNGLEGGVEMRYMYGDKSYDYSPSLNLRFRHDKLSLYTDVYGSKRKSMTFLIEDVEYLEQDMYSVIRTDVDGHNRGFRGQLGAIYDFDDRHSLGAEGSFGYYDDAADQTVAGDITKSPVYMNDLSDFYEKDRRPRVNATFNYVFKLDTLGSVFKVIGDFSTSWTRKASDYDTHTAVYQLPSMAFQSEYDMISRVRSSNDYGVYSISAGTDLHVSEKSMLRAGLKFTHNSMDDDAMYHNFEVGDWVPDAELSMRQVYSENVGAVYGTFSSKLGKVGYSLGLRGEYTASRPEVTRYGQEKSAVEKNTYFSLFPDANISIPLNSKQSNSLIFTYGRKIQRPSFWALNPFKIKVSEYSYIFGDPKLKPTYSNDISMTGVLGYKYSVTAGVSLVKDNIMQVVYIDEDNPDIRFYKQSNVKNSYRYYVNMNAPVEFTDWFSLNSNLYMMRYVQRIDGGDDKTYNNSLYLNSVASFTLPGKVYTELTFFYNSRTRWGSIVIHSNYNMHFGVKKRFVKDKLTASLTAYNFLRPKHSDNMDVDTNEVRQRLVQKQNWSRMNVVMSLRYNFQSGVKFKSKNVERSGDDSRMSGGK